MFYLYESGFYHRVCKGCHDPGSSGSLDVIHASWTENPAASKMDKAESAWGPACHLILRDLGLAQCPPAPWPPPSSRWWGSECCQARFRPWRLGWTLPPEQIVVKMSKKKLPNLAHPKFDPVALTSPVHQGEAPLLLHVPRLQLHQHHHHHQHHHKHDLCTKVSPHFSFMLPLFNSFLRSGSLVATDSFPSLTFTILVTLAKIRRPMTITLRMVLMLTMR